MHLMTLDEQNYFSVNYLIQLDRNRNMVAELVSVCLGIFFRQKTTFMLYKTFQIFMKYVFVTLQSKSWFSISKSFPLYFVFHFCKTIQYIKEFERWLSGVTCWSSTHMRVIVQNHLSNEE